MQVHIRQESNSILVDNLDKEYFCNSRKNLFLARYRYENNTYSYSHIFQREWGVPDDDERYFGAIGFDKNDNLHLFGVGGGSVQLDGNSGEAIGYGTGFQVTYSPEDELMQFKPIDLLLYGKTVSVPLLNGNTALIGGYQIGIINDDFEIVDEVLTDLGGSFPRTVDVAYSDKSFTILALYGPTIYNQSIKDFKFKAPSQDFALMNFDYNGRLNWYSYLGGDSEEDTPISINNLDNGNLLVVGNTNDNLDLDPSRKVNKYAFQDGKFFLAEYSTKCNGLNLELKSNLPVRCQDEGVLEFDVNGGTKPYEFFVNNESIQEYGQVGVSSPGIYSASVEDSELCSKQIYVPVEGPISNEDSLWLHYSSQEFRTGFEI